MKIPALIVDDEQLATQRVDPSFDPFEPTFDAVRCRPALPNSSNMGRLAGRSAHEYREH